MQAEYTVTRVFVGYNDLLAGGDLSRFHSPRVSYRLVRTNDERYKYEHHESVETPTSFYTVRESEENRQREIQNYRNRD